jgi:hypothetical protein
MGGYMSRHFLLCDWISLPILKKVESIAVKKYAMGKIWYYVEGDPRYEEQVRNALKEPGMCQVGPQFNYEDFKRALEVREVPDERIKEYLDNVTCINEAYLHNEPRW